MIQWELNWVYFVFGYEVNMVDAMVNTIDDYICHTIFSEFGSMVPFTMKS